MQSGFPVRMVLEILSYAMESMTKKTMDRIQTEFPGTFDQQGFCGNNTIRFLYTGG